MKKSILMALFLGSISFGSFAQNTQPQKPERSRGKNAPMENREKRTPEERATNRAKHMQEQLGLSDEQYQKVLAINLEQEKEREKMMAERKEQREANREAMKAKHEAMVKQYETVLTPEQMDKLRKKDEERQDKMKDRMQNGKGGRGMGKGRRMD